MDAPATTHDMSLAGDTALLYLPTEVILLVLSTLKPDDVLSVRKTCKVLCNITQDRVLWTNIYLGMSHETRYVLPGPAAADLFAPLTRAEVESLVLSVSLTERRWKLPRKPPKLLEASEVVCSAEEPMHTGMSILNMNILADRWLVVLYQGDAVEIWDLCPNSGSSASGVTRAWNGPGPEDTPCAPCAIRHTVQGLGPCCMSAVVLSEDGRDIILAVGSQVKTQVLRFNLAREQGTVDCECLATFETPSPLYTLRTVDPASHSVIYSHALSVCFVNWRTQKYCLVTSEEDGEELWSGIIGVALLTTHHVLCMTTRSIVVYTLDFVEDLQQPISPSTQRNPLYLYNIGRRTPVAQKQAIPDVAFRGVSFSKVRVVSGAETRRVSASLLTYDVLRGLFHFEVTLTLPHAAVRRAPAAPTPLDLSCTLLAAHRMAQLVPLEEIVQSGTPAPRSGFTPGSRGFISACALGAQGKRGVWIERQRSNMGRTVFGFAAADHRPPCVPREAGSASDGAAEERSVAEIDGRCIYAVRSSVDLRDDLTHCAFSEVTGRIALGTRRGQLLLL